MNGKKSLGWKPSLSIIGGVGWLIFIILWLAFFADAYPWEKNMAIFLLSILIIFLLIGGMWAIWSIRMIPKEHWEIFRISGFRRRISVSIAFPFIVLIFLIIWFWFFAEPFSVWQNIAVLIVVLLAMGGILGALWARWGITHSHHMKKMDEIGEDIGKKFEDAFEGKEED